MDIFKKQIIDLGDEKYEIKELSVGLIYKIEQGIIKDSAIEIIKECSNIPKETVEKLGVSTAGEIYKKIIELTYGGIKPGKETDKKK